MRRDEIEISGGFHGMRPITVRCAKLADKIRETAGACMRGADLDYFDYLSRRQLYAADQAACGCGGRCTCGGLRRCIFEAAE